MYDTLDKALETQKTSLFDSASCVRILHEPARVADDHLEMG